MIFLITYKENIRGIKPESICQHRTEPTLNKTLSQYPLTNNNNQKVPLIYENYKPNNKLVYCKASNAA